mmetsp:Transcript_61257/g.134146  ORF Transcript_61257/g.134146 Transcript_61257/m.134146 type:complete len:383 (-) Transcript_61257:165-1313(-)
MESLTSSFPRTGEIPILSSARVAPVSEGAACELFVVTGISFVCCFVLYNICRFLCPRLFGRHYTDLPDGQQIWWCQTMTALLPQVLIPVVELPDVLSLVFGGFKDASRVMYQTASPTLLAALGLTMGYIGFDLAVMIARRRALLSSGAVDMTMYIQLFLHHAAAVIVWPYAVLQGISAGYIVYLLATEFTGLWMNIRWLFASVKQDNLAHKRFLFVAVMFLTSYFFVRVVPIPWVIWLVLRFDPAPLTWPQATTAYVFMPIPAMLNAYWFKLIVEGVVTALTGGSSKGESKEDLVQLTEELKGSSSSEDENENAEEVANEDETPTPTPTSERRAYSKQFWLSPHPPFALLIFLLDFLLLLTLLLPPPRSPHLVFCSCFSLKS